MRRPTKLSVSGPVGTVGGSPVGRPQVDKVLEEEYQLDQRPFSRRNGMYMFRATHRETGMVRAVKIYDVRGADEHRTQRILDEAKLAQHVGSHPNVVSAYDFFKAPEKFSIIMDFWEGGTLLDELLHRGPMSEVRGGRLLNMLLQGLAHIHSKRVMHRDIKPENIFLSPQKEQGMSPGAAATAAYLSTPAGRKGNQIPIPSAPSSSAAAAGGTDKLAIGDFSLSTMMIPSSDYVGSPQYSAPELALIALHHERGNSSRPYYNEKCDIWSVGVVAFVMLTGLLPFDGDTPEEIFMQVVKNSIPFEKTPNLSRGAKEFVLALTKSNPSARPTAKDALRHSWLVNMR